MFLKRVIGFAILCGGLLSVPALAVVLVEDGEAKATVIIPVKASQETVVAVKEFVDTLYESTGVLLPVTDDVGTVETAHRVWIGMRPELSERLPEVDFVFRHPEESLIQASGNDLVLVGDDGFAGDIQTRAGTRIAVLSFLQDFLGVRWLWPGELGTDVPRKERVEFAPFVFRYHPQLRFRQIRAVNFVRRVDFMRKRGLLEKIDEIPGVDDVSEWLVGKDRLVRQWLNRQKADNSPSRQQPSPLRGSLDFRAGHAYQAWWARFHALHPDWFALQPDGTRSAYPSERDAKLCISNIGVAEQWLEDAVKFFQQNPHATTLSAAQNDHGWEGYCCCEECAAGDDPEGPMITEQMLRWKGLKEYTRSKTDSHARYWNRLAKGLKKAFPDRKLTVGVLAYHVEKLPPTKVRLEENIVVALVGIHRRNPVMNSRRHAEEQRALWKEWAEHSEQMVWRPNLIHRTSGLPYLFTKRHGENMQFLAENKLVGIDVDSIGNTWATQGPQYYVVAQLAWNPRLSVDELLKDYYERAFGPAAEAVAAYYGVFERLYGDMADNYNGGGWHIARSLPQLYREGAASAEVRAEAFLLEAEEAVKGAAEIYKKRVGFVRTGFEFTKAQLDVIESINTLWEGKVAEREENRAKVMRAQERRQAILDANVHNFALNYVEQLLSERERATGSSLYLERPAGGSRGEVR